jgi:hypothetical protein
MRRLSCRFCIFADKASLLLAGRHAPELLAEYVAVERETNHDFRHGFKIASVQEALLQGDNWGAPQHFAM